MNRNLTLLLTGVCAGGALHAGAQAKKEAPKTGAKPNIIYIMADDMGIGDVSCYGPNIIKTPNIDRLAEQGIRFTNHYTGCAVSAPSRCCLMTGLHTGHAYIRNNHSVRTGGRVSLRPEDLTIAELLKEQGYSTALYGKWGLAEPDTEGIPNDQGFDDFLGYLNQDHALYYYTEYLDYNRSVLRLHENDGGRQKTYSNDLFSKYAKDFIKKNQRNPFFIYLAYTIPHSLMQVPEEDRKPFRGKFVTDGKTQYDSVRATYCGMITRMDRQIGEMMQLLKELGLDENTIVMFTSDNGPTLGVLKEDYFDSNREYRGYKGDLYEGGIHTPFIARWPGKIKPGTTTDHISAFWDFLPTAVEIAGARMPAGIDGISYLPALTGQKQSAHDYLYWEFRKRDEPSQAVRMGDWKAVRIGGEGAPVEVYNLRTDVSEKKDVAAANPAIVKQAQEIFLSARTESYHYPLVSGPKGAPEANKKSDKKKK